MVYILFLFCYAGSVFACLFCKPFLPFTIRINRSTALVCSLCQVRAAGRCLRLAVSPQFLTADRTCATGFKFIRLFDGIPALPQLFRFQVQVIIPTDSVSAWINANLSKEFRILNERAKDGIDLKQSGNVVNDFLAIFEFRPKHIAGQDFDSF